MTAADEQRDAERAELLRELEAHRASGTPIPCLAGDTLPGDFWTSDDPDEQALAADGCLDCPALLRCETYGTTWTRETGVYGARTHDERRPRMGRPRKDHRSA